MARGSRNMFNLWLSALAGLAVTVGAARPVAAAPPADERLPGFEGYCPIVVRPGDTVRFRVAVANSSIEVAQGTRVETQVARGLGVVESSVRVVSVNGSGTFSPKRAASAVSGYVLATTGAQDAWNSYTLVFDAIVRAGAQGEQLSVAMVRDAREAILRRLDGIVYALPRDPGRAPGIVVIDMGAREDCSPALAATATATLTPTPTATPIPPSFVTRTMLSTAFGAQYSLAVVCVFDPARSGLPADGAEYRIALSAPESVRIALAMGANPDVAAGGRDVRFASPPDGQTAGMEARAAVAFKSAPGQPALSAAVIPKVLVSSSSGAISAGALVAGQTCESDPALMPALIAAEHARAAAPGSVARDGRGGDTPLAEATLTVTPTATVTPTPSRTPTSTPTRTVEEAAAAITPDGRAFLLPLAMAAGISLASLSGVFLARRRAPEE